MKSISQEEREDILDTMAVLFLVFDINDYALEEIVMGHIKPKEEIPLERYINEIPIRKAQMFENATLDIEGDVVDADLRIRDKSIETYRKNYFYYNMSLNFGTAEMVKDDVDEEGLKYFHDDLREYIQNMYPLFCSVLDTEVDCVEYEHLKGYTKKERWDSLDYISDFVSFIKVKKFKKNKDVSEYLENKLYIPFFVKKLLTEKNGKYYLANNDTDSLDYKLALISLLSMISSKNEAVLEAKCKRYAELQKNA